MALLIKIGGSVITVSDIHNTQSIKHIPTLVYIFIPFFLSQFQNKSEFETLNEPSILEFAAFVAALPQRGDMVIVHGAGSFGHFQVRQRVSERARD
jgi:isopentenyl phosphate kinase